MLITQRSQAVLHNSKDRIVFNYSFIYKGESLYIQLLQGPLSALPSSECSLDSTSNQWLSVVILKAMFHQVRLIPSDRPLLHFITKDLVRTEEPTVYEWQVLTFGSTCSPRCATYTLQWHVQDNKAGNETS